MGKLHLSVGGGFAERKKYCTSARCQIEMLRKLAHLGIVERKER
jgi:hypothetical protein